eukprot:scaffold54795_cov28-Tisochrysis_lutea.AAC.2
MRGRAALHALVHSTQPCHHRINVNGPPNVEHSHAAMCARARRRLRTLCLERASSRRPPRAHGPRDACACCRETLAQ